MSEKRDIDLPVCLLTVVGFQLLSMINRPFAMALAIVVMVSCVVFLWLAGAEKTRKGNEEDRRGG